LQALHDAVHGFALRVALLVELGQRIVKHGLGVDESTFEDCQIPDLRAALFGFWVVASDFRVNAMRARWAVGVSVRSSAIESGRMLTACDRTTETIISIESRAETTIGMTRATHLRLSLTAYLA
jgi:hypothetical protein